MYKRALMLTAATVALLAGPAYAANTTEPITTKTTTKLTTSGSNIAISTATNSGGATTSTGSVIIPSSSTASTTPAIEINSSNSVSLASGTLLSFNGTSSAIAIQADPGQTGEITNIGMISLTGTGSNKTGILIGSSATTSTTGTFTGLVDITNNPANPNIPFSPANPTGLTAIALEGGSTISIQGDGSNGIELAPGDTLKGDMVIEGSIATEATSLTSTAVTTPVTGITLENTSTMNGNILIDTGGTVVSTGAGAEGIVVLGQLNGAITNNDAIEAIGIATPTKTTGEPEAGSALIISNNVTGGIYNVGPGNGDTTTTRATIETTGTSAALDISPGFGGVTAAPVTVGGYADPLRVFGSTSLLNRGSITGAPTNTDDNAIAIAIGGVSSGFNVTLSRGIVNAGSISASATSDAKAASSTATALTIGNFVNVLPNTGTNNGFGAGFALVNSNESSAGTITASVSGASPGVATAITIGSGTASATETIFGSLYNSGTISASATSTDTTISSLAAYAIIDNSGTLTSIVNTGTISAGATVLDSLNQITQAINLSAATKLTTITNSGTIIGSVILGSGQDIVNVSGTPAAPASITGNIYFGGSADNVLTVDGGGQVVGRAAGATVTGNILETSSGLVAINVENGGTLTVTNNGLTQNGTALRSSTGTLLTGAEPGLLVSTLTVTNGSTLGLSLAQPFNYNAAENDGPVVKSAGEININAGAIVNLSFGSFVSSTVANPAQFIVFDAPNGNLIIANGDSVSAAVNNNIPFLFTGGLCSVNSEGKINGISACSAPPVAGTTDSQLVLQLAPKSAAQIGLTGYAAKMFPLANQALANDPAIGAAVIAAGSGLTSDNASVVQAEGQKIYQGVYSAFAPDVTGSSRAIAVAITDQATGPVGARQRALRMYAGQDDDATLWGQEFVERLTVSNSEVAAGYAHTGFGFAMGLDEGNPVTGRFGGALTFYSGNTAEKAPRTSKTSSEWVMATGYTDWRGKGLFFDSQLSAGYGNLTGKRSLVISDVTETTAQGKRSAALLAGGVTTGAIYHSGGTVFIPQISLDGMTMREEGYTESNSTVTTQATNGFDLQVHPYYASSVRGFAGADLRQDLKFSDFFLQPEIRAGYRYDLLDGAEKLRAEFACSTVATGSCGGTDFTITGPDPAKGNIVAGGGVAVTTGAWSIGLNYDYLRGVGGTGGIDQTATLSLIGKI